MVVIGQRRERRELPCVERSVHPDGLDVGPDLVGRGGAEQDAGEVRMAEREAARAAEAERLAAEEAARVAEQQAKAAEEAALKAEAKARAVALAAEQKAARDARYAARHARKR